MAVCVWQFGLLPKWYLLNVCCPPPANDAPRASPYPAAETMARLRRAALKDLLCTAIPELGSRVNPYSAGCTHFLPYRRCSGESGVPGGREHVGLLWVRRVAEPGRNQGGPSSRTNILTPSGQKVASLRCESWVRLGPRRSPSLLRPFASLFPRIPGYAAAHRTPTHSLCSLDCRDCGCSACSATQPASSWLPLLALGSAPGVFPRRSSAGLPSLRCLPTPCRAVGGQPETTKLGRNLQTSGMAHTKCSQRQQIQKGRSVGGCPHAETSTPSCRQAGGRVASGWGGPGGGEQVLSFHYLKKANGNQQSPPLHNGHPWCTPAASAKQRTSLQESRKRPWATARPHCMVEEIEVTREMDKLEFKPSSTLIESLHQENRDSPSKFPGQKQLWSYYLWRMFPQGCCLVSCDHRIPK
ncbi:uncharacterized protein LOC118601714 [Rousettus aegyptiacus]|uniref:uncharacterized protein LOC118601714 n=1 Tax=Rousettus aegyptiacus TaxID=9407 RepID=UPI00168D54CB|nr:uncharacterized protein LOC118601714 [Rousettus aegyptiacus]